jgi:hypothetical protein
MNEHGFIRSVNNQLKLLCGGSVFVWKIHTTFSGGTPDCWYSGASGDLWVEYKYLPILPRRKKTRIIPALSARQLSWLAERYAEGRNVLVVLGSPSGCAVVRGPEFGEGLYQNSFSLSVKEVAILLASATTERSPPPCEQLPSTTSPAQDA